MGLKLKSTGGTGSVELNCPDNHNINTSFTLPTSNFTGGEWVLADGSGNVNIDSGTLYVDAVNNRVGIGTTAGVSYRKLTLKNDGSAGGIAVTNTNDDIVGQFCGENVGTSQELGIYSLGNMRLYTGGTQRATIDSSGRLLVGTSSFSGTANNANDAGLIVEGNASDGGGDGRLFIARGAAALSDGQVLGALAFSASNHDIAAAIEAERDGGTWTAGSSQPTRLVFSTTANGASSPTERMRIYQNGLVSIPGVYSFTTAAAANVYVEPAGQLSRATSSSKYKTDIETLDDAYSDALLSCRPVWYRSTCEADNPDWGWWGFIAEEVAEIDPRLVHWKTTEITYDDKGSAVTVPCDPEPEGVQYERFVPHLLNLIKRQKERIETLEATNASFEARLTALEGGQP